MPFTSMAMSNHTRAPIPWRGTESDQTRYPGCPLNDRFAAREFLVRKMANLLREMVLPYFLSTVRLSE